MNVLGVGLAFSALSACGPLGRPMPALGPPWLTDANGRVVVYRGVNVAAEAAHTADYGTTLTFDDYEHLAGLGVTLVRFLVFWQALEPAPGMIDASAINLAETRIRAF